jgi:hypothetical protein
MNSIENIREITLTSLITKNRVKMKEEIVLQYQLSIEEKKKIKIENEISRISDYFIKYLDVNTHFFISKNTISFLNIDESSIRSIKFTSNVQMMKKFCELIRDSAINKRWIKFKKFRITAEQSMFLLVLNKKIKNVDYTTLNLSIVTTFVFHFVTIHESRIAQNKVWFTRSMFTTQDRVNATKIIAREHLQWKIQVHTQYKKQCRRYVKQRILWEIQLMKKALEVSNIIWSSYMSNESRLSLLRNVKISTDCIKLIEVENDWDETFIYLSTSLAVLFVQFWILSHHYLNSSVAKLVLSHFSFRRERRSFFDERHLLWQCQRLEHHCFVLLALLYVLALHLSRDIFSLCR